jgi:hypothetical protein
MLYADRRNDFLFCSCEQIHVSGGEETMETALPGENDPSQTKTKRSIPSAQEVQTVTSRQAIKDTGEIGGAPSVSEKTTGIGAETIKESNRGNSEIDGTNIGETENPNTSSEIDVEASSS